MLRVVVFRIDLADNTMVTIVGPDLDREVGAYGCFSYDPEVGLDGRIYWMGTEGWVLCIDTVVLRSLAEAMVDRRENSSEL